MKRNHEPRYLPAGPRQTTTPAGPCFAHGAIPGTAPGLIPDRSPGSGSAFGPAPGKAHLHLHLHLLPAPAPGTPGVAAGASWRCSDGPVSSSSSDASCDDDPQLPVAVPSAPPTKEGDALEPCRSRSCHAVPAATSTPRWSCHAVPAAASMPASRLISTPPPPTPA